MIGLAFTGHSLSKLYGDDLSDIRYSKLVDALERLFDYYGPFIDEVIVGGATGLDTLALLTASRMKSEYPFKIVLCIPFESQARYWSERDKLLYDKCKVLADEIVYVDTLDNYKVDGVPVGHYSADKFKMRNKYMVDRCQYLVALWGGNYKSGTYSCITYARKCRHVRSIMMMCPTTLQCELDLKTIRRR